LRDSDLLSKEQAESLITDCDELIRIIGKIQSTIRKKIFFED